ncbi:MAG: hypothetical protein AAGK32_11920 [Actinomycetota bacterium]
MDRRIFISRTCHRPVEEVAELLRTNAAAVLQSATDAAVIATNDIVLTLDGKWAWFDLHEEVHAEVGELTSTIRRTSLPLSWRASGHKRLLPGVEGHLNLYPMTSRYTEISFSGEHDPPAGVLDSIGDRVVGRRVIEAAIGHLLDDVVSRLEREAPNPATVS